MLRNVNNKQRATGWHMRSYQAKMEYIQSLNTQIYDHHIRLLSRFDSQISKLCDPYVTKYHPLRPKTRKSHSFNKNKVPCYQNQQRSNSAHGNTFGFENEKIKLSKILPSRYYTQQQFHFQTRRRFRIFAFAVIALLKFKKTIRFIFFRKYRRKTKLQTISEKNILILKDIFEKNKSRENSRQLLLTQSLLKKQKKKKVSSSSSSSSNSTPKSSDCKNQKTPTPLVRKSQLILRETNNKALRAFYEQKPKTQQSQSRNQKMEFQESKLLTPTNKESLLEFHQQFLKQNFERKNNEQLKQKNYKKYHSNRSINDSKDEKISYMSKIQFKYFDSERMLLTYQTQEEIHQTSVKCKYYFFPTTKTFSYQIPIQSKPLRKISNKI